MTQIAPSTIDEILSSRRIIITCGTGGVGKTTLSAALAVRAAQSGRKAVVITIDPAKRLATSLGLSTLGDAPTDLTHLLGAVPGTLAAIMPDTRETFETFIRSISPTPTVAERVIKNPIYEIFAKEFSGANEYMALQRLLALDRTGQFDCIILDTPPSRDTLAFLDAPELLSQFFEERFIKWFILPANQVMAVGVRKALGVLENLTGAGFVTHLFDFAQSLFETRLRFAADLKAVTALLESSASSFVLVTGTSPESAREIGDFARSVAEHKFRFDGVIINRTLGLLDAGTPSTPGENAALRLLVALQTREKEAIGILKGALGKAPYFMAPELARDVHSIHDLIQVAQSV